MLAGHASDRRPRFSLPRERGAGSLRSSLHRQGDELVCERCMDSRRGSGGFWIWPPLAAKPLHLACMGLQARIASAKAQQRSHCQRKAQAELQYTCIGIDLQHCI